MKKEDFEFGKEFYTATGKWRCTDIGTRVIVAIHLNQEDPKNYNGPPYSIPESVFDEYDMEGCSLDPIDFEEKQEKITKMGFLTQTGENHHRILSFYLFGVGGDIVEIQQSRIQLFNFIIIYATSTASIFQRGRIPFN